MEVKTVTVKLQCMADGEISKHISTADLERIKEKDPHPLFQAFVLGHEGNSFPQVVGRKSGAIITWLTNGVKAIYEKLKKKTKVFFNHSETNEHTGRNPIGELVGKTLDTINGKLHTIGIIYRYPQYRDLKAEVASIETDIDAPENFKTLEADEFNVRGISGIALASKKNEKPAFPGATLQAAVQFLQSNENEEKKVTPKEVKTKMDEDKMLTLKQIMDFINDNKVLPTQLFTVKQIVEDQQVMGHVTENYVPKKTHDEAVQKLTTEKDGYKGKIDRIEIDKTVADAIKERKIENEKLEKFLLDNIQHFKQEENGKSLKIQLDTYLNTQIEKFNSYFTKEEKPGTGNEDAGADDNDKEEDEEEDGDEDEKQGKTQDKTKGVGPAAGDGKTGGVDYTDPKHNPFIGD